MSQSTCASRPSIKAGLALRCALPCVVISLASLPGCVPGNPSGSSGRLMVSVEGGRLRIAGEGDEFTLAARAAGGVAPYVFRWSQERGDDVLAADVDLTARTITTTPLTSQGEYSFRVVATDAAGTRVEQWVLLRVGPAGACTEAFCVVIDGPDTLDFAQTAELSAFVSTQEDVTITWSVLSGPADLSSRTGETTTFDGATLGRVVLEVEVRTADGQTTTDTHEVAVVPAITVEPLHLARTGQALTVTASAAPEEGDIAFAWEVVEGQADLADAQTPSVTVTPAAAETVTLRVTASAAGAENQAVTAERDVSVVAVRTLAPRVVISTHLGELVLELDADKAPLTTASFLRYVDEGFYDGVTIHRFSCELDFQTGECREPFVIQGGGYEPTDAGLTLKTPTHPPVPGEQDNGLSNTLHTVGMALSANDPDSATTQFFFNLNDDNARLDGDFTAFGRVVAGTQVLDAIMALETRPDPITGGRDELLVEPVVMISVRRQAAP